jgi:hypothetical protein
MCRWNGQLDDGDRGASPKCLRPQSPRCPANRPGMRPRLRIGQSIRPHQKPRRPAETPDERNRQPRKTRNDARTADRHPLGWVHIAPLSDAAAPEKRCPVGAILPERRRSRSFASAKRRDSVSKVEAAIWRRSPGRTEAIAMLLT